MDQLLAMRVFTRVVEAQSFSRAAEQLAMPRSTVSKLVAELEKDLGTQLIHRTTRRLSITADGADYYTSAARIVGEIETTHRDLRERNHAPSGTLRIEVPSSFANNMLIPALRDFRRRYPNLVLSVGIGDRSVNIVGEGVDCAIRAGELADTSLIARRLFDFHDVTFAARSYLERYSTPHTPDDLTHDHQLVGYFVASSSKVLPMVFERDGHFTAVDNFAILANESTGHINMIRSGLGIGQNLLETIQPYLDTGEIVTVLDDWKREPIPFHLIYPPNPVMSSRQRTFIDWMIERFEQQS